MMNNLLDVTDPTCGVGCFLSLMVPWPGQKVCKDFGLSSSLLQPFRGPRVKTAAQTHFAKIS